MDDRPATVRSNRLPERAAVLTAATFVLLTPPILNIFDVHVPIFGIPLLHIYCFGVWLAAIGLGAWLGPRMDAAASNPAVELTAPRRDEP